MDEKNMLSQEEIDALLKNDGDNDLPSDSEELSDFEVDALGEIGNISFGSASTSLSTILGHKVEITTPQVELIDPAQLKVDFPTPHVAISVEYTEGFMGTNLFIIKKMDAAIIADLMMGGEGKVESDELTEIHTSAVQEAMNQMMGAAATSMSTIFNMVVNISPPTIKIVNFAEGDQPPTSMQTGKLVKIFFRLTVGDLIDSFIMQLLPLSFAKEMVRHLARESNVANPEQPNQETGQEAQGAVETAAAAEAAATAEPALNMPPPPNTREGERRIAERGEQDRLSIQREVQRAEFTPLESEMAAGDKVNFDLFMDIPLQVTVELGRTEKTIQDLMAISPGSVIELDKLAGEPVDIFVNQKLIARGEVVVVDENFGVRVTEIYSKRDQLLTK